MHPREETPAVCLIAGQEIERLRELLDNLLPFISDRDMKRFAEDAANPKLEGPRNG